MIQLLRDNRPFAVLWSARSVSFLGDSLSLVALMLHVAGETEQALAVALLLLVGDFVPGLFGPLTGAISDRYDHKRVMVACELVQGLVTVVIALWLPGLPVLLALVGVRALAGQLFQAASRSVVPALVEDRDLARANTAIGLGTNGGEALGPLAAWLLLPWLGIGGVLLVDAATFAVSALLLAFLPATGRAGVAEPRRALLRETWRGLRYIVTTRTVRAVALGFVGVVAFNGIDDVAVVFLVTEELRGPASDAGLVLSAVGIGLFAGYALVARLGRARMAVLLVAGFAVSSAGNLLTGLAWAVAAAFAVQAVRGLGIAAMDVAANTLVQRTADPAMLGRVFGSLYGGVGVAAALSYVG
ncbi:MFS transporter, partial [Nonomuraea antri]|uniref:MFS transporter n=1 Tax=Nonomuraea antri TaxID=2730852 RepID=UPI001C2CC4B8